MNVNVFLADCCLRALHLQLELLGINWSPLVLSCSNRRKWTNIFSWVMLILCSSKWTLYGLRIKLVLCFLFSLENPSNFEFSCFLYCRRARVHIERVSFRLFFNDKLRLQLRKYKLFCSLRSQILDIDWLLLSVKIKVNLICLNKVKQRNKS